jgi:hypothetical protein
MMANVEDCVDFSGFKANRYEVEENAVFLDYKIETLVEEIEKYSSTKFHIRLSLAKNLKTIEDTLINDYDKFTLLLEKLVRVRVSQSTD